MIPIGTLCLVIPCDRCRLYADAESRSRIGQTCEVSSSPLAAYNFGYDCVVRFPDGSEYGARYCDLKPIALPGDPDAVPHDVSEPELVEVFK